MLFGLLLHVILWLSHELGLNIIKVNEIKPVFGIRKIQIQDIPDKVFLVSSSRTSFVRFGAENGFSLRRSSFPVNCHLLFFSVCFSHVVHK